MTGTKYVGRAVSPVEDLQINWFLLLISGGCWYSIAYDHITLISVSVVIMPSPLLFQISLCLLLHKGYMKLDLGFIGTIQNNFSICKYSLNFISNIHTPPKQTRLTFTASKELDMDIFWWTIQPTTDPLIIMKDATLTLVMVLRLTFTFLNVLLVYKSATGFCILICILPLYWLLHSIFFLGFF